jgi:hypothetical protein
MPEIPEPLAGDLIRREWSTVARGEEQRTTWLEAELAAIGR